MADRRKLKKKKESDPSVDEDKPSKVEYEVAKYLRKNLQEKRTNLLGHKVDYFISSKAIDSLLESKWAKDEEKSQAIFTSRESVIDFLQTMLHHKFFHRARKIIVRAEPKKKKGEEESSAAEDLKEKKEKLKKKSDKTSKDGSEEKVEKKKEKKKVKLDMHLEQIFVDGNEPFVWIYDPIPLKAWFIGLGLVFGAVAICLFPLWPRVVRNYVYYLSIAAAGFLFFIIALAILRLVVFCIVWGVTFGNHHFWLLPNLTEDVGFVQSFIPLYQYDYMGEKKKGDKKKKDKLSDDEADADDKNAPEVIKEKEEKEVEEASDSQTNDSEGSESGSQNVNGSDNGFELLDNDEIGKVEIAT